MMLLGFWQDGNTVLLFLCSVIWNCLLLNYPLCKDVFFERKEDERTEAASGQRLIWGAVAACDDREVGVTIFFVDH